MIHIPVFWIPSNLFRLDRDTHAHACQAYLACSFNKEQASSSLLFLAEMDQQLFFPPFPRSCKKKSCWKSKSVSYTLIM